MNWQISLGTGLQMLGLALMAGGMLAIGAFAAPVMFKQLARPEAGDILTVIFRRYDNVLLVALGIIILGEALRLLPGLLPVTAPLAVARYVILGATVGMVLFSIFKVNADIETMHKAGIRPDTSPQGQVFHETHKLSEGLYKLEMLGAALLILLTPFIRPAG